MARRRNSSEYGRWEQATRPSMDRGGVQRWDSWYFIVKGQPLIAIGRAGPEGPWGTVPASAKPAGGWSMFFFRVPDSGKGLGRTWMSLGLGGDMTSFGTPSGPVPKTLAEAKKLAMEYAGGVDPTKGGPETKRWIALRPPSWESMWWEKWGKARAQAKARAKAKNVGPGFDILGLALEKARAKAKAKKNGPTRDRPHYPFAEKEEQYRTYSNAQLYHAMNDAAATSRAQKGWDQAGSNWYMDDYHTIVKEIHNRKRSNPMARRRRNPKTRGVALPARVTKRVIEEYVKADFADPRSGRWEPRLWLEGQHDELGLRGPQIKGETVQVWNDQGVPISNISLYRTPSGKYKYRAWDDHFPRFNQPHNLNYDPEYDTPMEAVEALLDENDEIWEEYAVENE